MNNSLIFGAIDIGSTGIRIIIADKNEQNQLQVIGYSEEKCEILKQGQIINQEIAAQVIAKAIERSELMVGREVGSFFLNLPSILSEGVYSNGIIAIDKDKEVDVFDINRVMEISQSISLPAERQIIHNIPLSFKIDGIEVDEPVGASGVRLEANVYLIHYPKSSLENFNKVMYKTNYKPEDFINENIASAEAALTEEEKKSGAVVLDVGYKKTSVTYYSNLSVTFMGHVPVGGYHITKDISYALKTSEKIAEEIKLKYGCASELEIIDDEIIEYQLLSYQKVAKVSKKIVSRIIEARIEELLQLAKDNLNSFEKYKSINNVIVVTGGGALLPGLDTLVTKVFGEPSRVGSPVNIKGLDDKINNPRFTTCLGLIKYADSKSRAAETDENIGEEPRKENKVTKYLRKFFT